MSWSQGQCGVDMMCITAAYFQHSCLWDELHSDYYNEKAKEAAIADICSSLGARSVHHLQVDIQCMESSYLDKVNIATRRHEVCLREWPEWMQVWEQRYQRLSHVPHRDRLERDEGIHEIGSAAWRENTLSALQEEVHVRLATLYGEGRREHREELWDWMARELPGTPIVVREYWSELQERTRGLLLRSSLCGDVVRVGAGDSALMDAMLLYDGLQALPQGPPSGPCVLSLSVLVRLAELLGVTHCGPRWNTLRKLYAQRGRFCSAVLLQRRWHEIREMAARGDDTPLILALRDRFPFLSRCSAGDWAGEVASGLVFTDRELDVMVDEDIQTIVARALESEEARGGHLGGGRGPPPGIGDPGFTLEGIGVPGGVWELQQIDLKSASFKTKLILDDSDSDDALVISEDPDPDALVISEDPDPDALVISEDPDPDALVISEDPDPDALVISEDPDPDALVISEDPVPVDPPPEPPSVKPEEDSANQLTLCPIVMLSPISLRHYRKRKGHFLVNGNNTQFRTRNDSSVSEDSTKLDNISDDVHLPTTETAITKENETNKPTQLNDKNPTKDYLFSNFLMSLETKLKTVNINKVPSKDDNYDSSKNLERETDVDLGINGKGGQNCGNEEIPDPPVKRVMLPNMAEIKKNYRGKTAQVAPISAGDPFAGNLTSKQFVSLDCCRAHRHAYECSLRSALHNSRGKPYVWPSHLSRHPAGEECNCCCLHLLDNSDKARKQLKLKQSKKKKKKSKKKKSQKEKTRPEEILEEEKTDLQRWEAERELASKMFGIKPRPVNTVTYKQFIQNKTQQQKTPIIDQPEPPNKKRRLNIIIKKATDNNSSTDTKPNPKQTQTLSPNTNKPNNTDTIKPVDNNIKKVKPVVINTKTVKRVIINTETVKPTIINIEAAVEKIPATIVLKNQPEQSILKQILQIPPLNNKECFTQQLIDKAVKYKMQNIAPINTQTDSGQTKSTEYPLNVPDIVKDETTETKYNDKLMFNIKTECDILEEIITSKQKDARLALDCEPKSLTDIGKQEPSTWFDNYTENNKSNFDSPHFTSSHRENNQKPTIAISFVAYDVYQFFLKYNQNETTDQNRDSETVLVSSIMRCGDVTAAATVIRVNLHVYESICKLKVGDNSVINTVNKQNSPKHANNKINCNLSNPNDIIYEVDSSPTSSDSESTSANKPGTIVIDSDDSDVALVSLDDQTGTYINNPSQNCVDLSPDSPAALVIDEDPDISWRGPPSSITVDEYLSSIPDRLAPTILRQDRLRPPYYITDNIFLVTTMHMRFQTATFHTLDRDPNQMIILNDDLDDDPTLPLAVVVEGSMYLKLRDDPGLYARVLSAVRSLREAKYCLMQTDKSIFLYDSLNCELCEIFLSKSGEHTVNLDSETRYLQPLNSLLEALNTRLP